MDTNTSIKLMMPFLLALFLCFSCKNEMRPINYGQENCEQCRMTITNPKFGAGLLTSKGKVLTFDSGECLVKYIKLKGLDKSSQYFVSDYNKTASLMDAAKAVFLHSSKIESPMGGNLAAFANEALAKAAQNDLGGDIFSWDELIAK